MPNTILTLGLSKLLGINNHSRLYALSAKCYHLATNLAPALPPAHHY
jgi:hypothetical protein